MEMPYVFSSINFIIFLSFNFLNDRYLILFTCSLKEFSLEIFFLRWSGSVIRRKLILFFLDIPLNLQQDHLLIAYYLQIELSLLYFSFFFLKKINVFFKADI